MQSVLLTLCIFYFVRHSDAAVEDFNWAYGSTLAPKYWKNNYKMCGGAHQSPINIVTEDAKYDSNLKPFDIKLQGSESTYKITNYGLNFDISFGTAVWKATFSGSTDYCYQLLQMHFHWGSSNGQGSEHTIDGKKYPIEVHYVMWNCQYYTDPSKVADRVNGLAVIGVMYEVDNSITPNPTLQKIVDHLKNPAIKKCPCSTASDTATLTIPYFDVNSLLPTDRTKFYRYKGSLTTPPCTENVLWTVYKNPLKITDAQLAVFRSLLNRNTNNGGITNMVNNYRPVMPLNPSVPVSALRYVSTSAAVTQSSNVNSVMLSVLIISTLSTLINNFS